MQRLYANLAEFCETLKSPKSHCLWLLLIFLQACATGTQADAAPSAQPSHADLQDMIDLAIIPPAGSDFGGELAVLPVNDRVTIDARVVDRIPQNYKVTQEKAYLYWQTDAGTLLYDDRQMGKGLSNLWVPPVSSGASTITLTYEADYRTQNETDQPFKVRKEVSLQILSPTSSDQFVNGQVDGYTIGEYPNPYDQTIFANMGVEESNFPSKYPEKYVAPQGFYKITPEIVEKKISHHLSLRFFTMDFPWASFGYPQYIALDLNLVRKLEDLLDLLRQNGIMVSTFKPIYGFRPPAYNLGTMQLRPEVNLKAPFSMHQYGKAVDLIIDEDGDDRLDDLNHDGQVDVFDAAELVKYVNVLDKRYRDAGDEAVGGAGIYDRHDFEERPVQSPYVHVDVRGYTGNGGALVRWPGMWPKPGQGVIQWATLYPGQAQKDLAAMGPAE